MDQTTKQLLEQALKTQIVQALTAAPDIIEKLVQAALSQDVNEYGAPPKAYGEAKMPYLDFLVGQSIRTAARDAVLEKFKEMESEIKEAVKKSLSTDKVVDSYTQAILTQVQGEYSMDVTVKFKDEKNA